MKNGSTSTSPTITTVVPAAGVGKRMGTDIPKQYLPLAGKTVLEQTLTRLREHPAISDIILVVSSEDEFIRTLSCSRRDWLHVVPGGKERSDSVLNGVKEVPSDWVLVHDAARPCVRVDDIDKLLQLAEGEHGGILAKQATDTIKMAQSSNVPLVKQSVPREQIWHALTPQFFPTSLLRNALQHCADKNIAITDEASAIEAIKGTVKLIAGHADNIKITQPGDLALAEFFLKSQKNK